MSKFEVVVGRRREADAVNVGRPTALGNPFVAKSEADRDRVCDEYEKWFAAKVAAQDEQVMNMLRALWRVGVKRGELKLGCYCAPRRCHADTIARFLRKYAE